MSRVAASPFVSAAVAALVVIAGGGVGYFATTSLGVAQVTGAPSDPAKVADAVVRHFKTMGVDGAVDRATANGRDIVLSGVRLAPKGGKDTVALADIRLENVVDTDGGYKVGRIQVPASKISTRDGTWHFGGATLRDITLPADPAQAFPMFYPEGLEIGESTFVLADGRVPFRMGKLVATSTPLTFDQDIKFKLSPVALQIDDRAIPGADPVKAVELRALGFSPLDLRFGAEGSWLPKTGRLVMETAFDIPSAAKLALKMDVSGYTPELIRALNQTAERVDAANAQKLQTEMLGLAQQLTLHGLSVRFDDRSLTGKLLDLAAQRAGQSRKMLVEQLKNAAPMLVVFTGDPAFSRKAAEAIATFLDNPKSIEIKAAPAEPVPAIQLALGAVAPQGLIKLLNLQITANK